MRKDLAVLHISKIALLAMSIAIYSAPAFAHPGHEIHNTVVQGFLHPVSGVDHVLAMLSVGFLAFGLGGRALWAIPAAFVAMMIAGGVLGMTGSVVPGVEQGIATSALIFGVLIALAGRVALPAVIALVGLFATFHGVPHGKEGAIGGSIPFFYFLGFLLATVALHAVGIALGVMFSAFQQKDMLQRIAGWATGLTGMLMLLG